MIGFLVVEEVFIRHNTNLVFWLGLLLFGEKFDMLLIWRENFLIKSSLAPPFQFISDHWEAHLNENQWLKLANESQPFLKEKRVLVETLGHS